jgi:predicted site-specific integrase-resolvase
VEHPITQPLRAFCREQKISPTQAYRWADEGEIETVLIGARRHIVVESYTRMIKRRRAEQAGAKLPSSNPKEGAAGTPARIGDTSAR